MERATFHLRSSILVYTSGVTSSDTRRAVAICSGGLDSSVLAFLLREQGFDLHLLGFDYGQRHVKELSYASELAVLLGAKFSRVDVSGLRPLLSGSALTDDIAVPHGHYAAPNMAITVVPNRNALMLSIAYAAAVSDGAEVVACGVHAGDHHVYPDCRPAFIESFDAMQRVATEGFAHPKLRLFAPFVSISKADIVREGARLGVPFEETWSCYEGGEIHCGRCGTCVERAASFAQAGVSDPTLYADANFWREAS